MTNFYEDNPTYLSPTVDNDAWPKDTPEQQRMRSATLNAGATYLSSIPQSLSFLVLRNGALIKEVYFHGSRPNHSNNIHSASKTLIGLLVGIAIREGFIKSVDQPISEILYPKFKISEAKKKITVRHLLTMSAGLQWTEDESEYDLETTKNWVQSILNLRQQNKVGTKFNYSTALTHTLSAIITESSGMGICEFADKYVFSRMGMTFEHWGRDKQGYYSGGYNLYLKPRELLKLGQLILQNGVWKKDQVVPTDWIQESVQSKILNDHNYGYGYLMFLPKVSGHQVYKMWGYGGQYALIVPDYNLVVVLTADTKKEYPEMDAENFLASYVIKAVVK